MRSEDEIKEMITKTYEEIGQLTNMPNDGTIPIELVNETKQYKKGFLSALIYVLNDNVSR